MPRHACAACCHPALLALQGCTQLTNLDLRSSCTYGGSDSYGLHRLTNVAGQVVVWVVVWVGAWVGGAVCAARLQQITRCLLVLSEQLCCCRLDPLVQSLPPRALILSQLPLPPLCSWCAWICRSARRRPSRTCRCCARCCCHTNLRRNSSCPPAPTRLCGSLPCGGLRKGGWGGCCQPAWLRASHVATTHR
jgi:hypothetical protein